MKRRKVKTGTQVHAELYRQIPTFECKPGCTDCCGPVPFSAWEWWQIKDKRRPTAEEAKAMRCPYARGGRCEIYGQRPLMCRLFGTVETLRCPHGCRPTKLLTELESRRLLETYRPHVLS